MSVERARTLRKNATDAERRLWRHLRDKQLDGFRFRRQVPIGRYVADFACLSARLVVEVDGGQHAERLDYDGERTEWLEARGFRVLRFWNNDVLGNTEGVIEQILAELHAAPHPGPRRGLAKRRSSR
jgi:very-short-patch-repair endonuclease